MRLTLSGKTQHDVFCLTTMQRHLPPLHKYLRHALVTYQPVAIADRHRGLRHVAHVSSENAVPVDPFLGLFHKVLLPFHKSPRGHQPPVGSQTEVQLLPKHGDIEKQTLGRGDLGHLGDTACHPFSSAAKGCGAIAFSTLSILTFTSAFSREHMGKVPTAGVCAEWHDKTIFT